MENKVKRKRKISVFTIFLWLALVITMSVVVVSGTNKSNALEDTTAEEVGITGVKRIKLDLTEVIENEKITEQTEIEAFLEGYKEKIKVSNVNNSTSTVNADITYVGSEQEAIGIYEINLVNEAKYIRIESNEYEILNNNEVLELYCNSGKGYYFERLSESINEYSFIVRKKDTKIVTIKIDFTDLINIRGITEQSEIEPILEDYASRLTGRIKKEDTGGEYITLKSKYVRSENSTIGVYEVEITNDMKYIQMTKPVDSEYTELSNLPNMETCNMLNDGVPLEIGGYRNNYGYITSGYGCVYVQKILEDVNEYNIFIEKNKITIKLDDKIVSVTILDNTNKIAQNINFGLKNNLRLSKRNEYDIIFYVKENSYGAPSARKLFDEDGNEIEQKILYNPLTNKESSCICKTINPGDSKLEYSIEAIGKFESNIFWEDDKHAKLQFKLIESWKYYRIKDYYYDSIYEKSDLYQSQEKYIIFIERLDENFSVSSEYENNSKWLIVNEDEVKNTKFYGTDYDMRNYLKLDLENNEYIPEYVYANFFVNSFIASDKIRNIYIKDRNMLYCLIPMNEPEQELFINLEYKGDKKDKLYKFNTKNICFYNQFEQCLGLAEQSYYGSTLTEKYIKYTENKKTRIIVNKSVEKKEENNTFYVGLFDNENESNTDKIYSIDIVNGVGNTKIEFEGYDDTKKYYIYEVDENGNKIENENLIYNKNKVLEDTNKKEEYNILSDKNIISSVFSKSVNEGYFGEKNIEGTSKYTSEFKKITDDIGKGKGEEYYKDNSLVATEVYEDIVTISENNEKPYLVRYETKKGGKLEGDKEEIVIEGNKPINVPNVIVNDGYKFDKWVVIKDGEEVEVNPSEYVVLEDTTFIAKYKEIKIEENRDTSDINVLLYVGIAVISVIVICIIVLVLNIKNKNKKLK